MWRGGIPTTREAAEAMDAARGELDELNGHIKTLENIRERMMQVDSFEVKGSAGLSPEGYKLYRQIMEMLEKIGGEQKEDKQTKVARMNAMLFAHHADIFAAAMRTQEGKEEYTALDYFRDRFALRYGGKDMRQNGLYQSATNVPSAEKDAVRKQYEGTEQWMKAPNGEPTNLTEDQWIAVRTPAFKAWFGDWEAEAEKQKYLNTAPINVTDKKITKSRGITARDAAMAWADVHLPVQVSTRFGVVEINRTSVKDSLGHGFSQKKLDAITSLPEGMKVAAFIGETKDFNGADIDNGYFCYPIMYQGEKQVVFCRARRDVNSNKIYVHEVWTEDEIKGIPLQTAAKFSNSKPHGGNTLYKSILADFLNKGNDCSKIVDENGEPMVVYHGSDADFDVFDKTKGRANMDIQGMFFSPWELDSKGYGANVRAFFLNIRKPANEGQCYKALNRHKGKNGAGVKAREDLITAGFDGVNNSDEEFIAFEPNQIKSATDNNGAFSPDDANIYHQKDSLDNDMADSDNESRISDAVFQKYLNDGIMEMVRDRVSAEIAEHVNLADMADPIKRDAARDRLPYIREMLVHYNDQLVQNNLAYKNRMAAKIEYARRCFDNDPRIQHGDVRPMDGHSGQRGVYEARQGTVSGSNGEASVRPVRRVARGVSRAVSGERSGARAHFDKLYNDMQKHLESQGAFSMLKQMLRQEVRGEISQEDGKRIITLFESADESTFMHEMGHMFLISHPCHILSIYYSRR